MIDLVRILRDGAILSAAASLLLIAALAYNPRIFLHDYPEAIQAQVPPKTANEKRQSALLGVPFLLLLAVVPFLSTLALRRSGGTDVSFLNLFLNAFGVSFFFNLVDLLLLDWLLFCTLTPKFLVIPGSEGNPAYKDYGYHFRGSLVGTAISVVAGLVIAAIVWVI